MKKKKWPFVYVALITVLTYIPILLTVVYSFNASKLTSVWEGFSLKWYRELFRDRDLGEALINSLILAVLSCAFAVLIGTSGALGMSRRKRKLDDAVAYVSTQIHRMTEAGVLRQGDQTHLRFPPLFCRCLFFATPFAVQIFHAPVSRTIVYDQHFIFRCIFLSLTQGSHAFR